MPTATKPQRDTAAVEAWLLVAGGLVAAERDGRATRWTAETWVRVLRCLSRRQRRVVILLVLRGLTQEQAAAELGIGRGGVSMLYRNAMRRLQALDPELLARLREDTLA